MYISRRGDCKWPVFEWCVFRDALATCPGYFYPKLRYKFIVFLFPKKVLVFINVQNKGEYSAAD